MIKSEIRNSILNETKELLANYGYEGLYHLGDVTDDQLYAKKDLRALFRKHPNWNEEKQMLIFPGVDTFRPADPDTVDQFATWVQNQLGNLDYTEFRSELRDKIHYLCSIATKFASEELATEANNIRYWVNRESGTWFKEGQKTSRIITELCTIAGLDKIKDIREVTWKDQSGNVHSRMKDFGWNDWRAKFGDAINPIAVKRTVCISINQIDYYTMSFGKKWASCMTIDKENRRHTPSHNYGGCYSGGVMSYALDKVTIVMYYISEDYDGNEPELQDKYKRCLFFYKDGVLIQSRVYPDGRDGGDAGAPTEMREMMQSVIAKCLDTPNSWKKKSGCGEVCDHVEYSDGVMYRDWESCEDVTISFLKNEDLCDTNARLRIGEAPICPCCGRTHDWEESFMCWGCYNDKRRCEYCDEFFDEDEMVETIDGHHYCYRCAQYNGYVAVEDESYWYPADDVQMDDRTEYYYSPDYPMIHASDGNTYSNEYSAITAGYVQAKNGEWYPKDEVVYIDHIDSYMPKDQVKFNEETKGYELIA